MTNIKGVTMTHNTRSSQVSFDVDPPRPVELKPPAYHVFGADEYVAELMVTKVDVMCSWNTGGYNLIAGYPIAGLMGDEGERHSLTELVSIPDWLSDVIAAGTPTDLEHPAA